MSKLTVAVSAPIDTYSGYGARSRDLVKVLIESKKYNLVLLSQRWGNTRFGYLEDHSEEEMLSLISPGLQAQPDIWIQITVPNEFQKVGKYNIGITAGMETTLVHQSWVEGVNRMDLVLTSSNHSKKVFEQSQYEMKDKNTNQTINNLKVETPIEVLFEGVDIGKYFSVSTKSNYGISENLDSIKESFCYLLVGHWMQGDFGHDRKNVGYTIKTFLESFKTKRNPPALILKTHTATTSILDRERILDKIDSIKKTVKGGRLPNIYLIHGEISDEEMNVLYNHSKVKVLVSHTKGEGFGRPLLEFTTTGKPIIASGWSGQVDFLHRDYSVLLGGTLQNVHPSACVKDMILPEAQWFTPSDSDVNQAYKKTFKHYKQVLAGAKKQRRSTLDNFTYDKMASLFLDILDKNIPDMPKQIELTLPKLDLPKLEKI